MKKLLTTIFTILLFSCGKEVPTSKAMIKFTAGAAGVATQTGGVLVVGGEVPSMQQYFSSARTEQTVDLHLRSLLLKVPIGQAKLVQLASSWQHVG